MDQNIKKLQGYELSGIRGVYIALCPRHFGMKALF